MSFFSRLFGADKSQPETNTASRNESAVSLHTTDRNVDNHEEIVASIMAALMNILSEENNGELRIKSIRRVGRNSPVWNIAGRDEYIASKI